jgi:nucleotidyltransferase substrate binding protein (TIGR01987 family)
MAEDIRWTQRFDNFKRSLKQLDDAMALVAERDLSELEKQGVIQAFEYNYELAWNVIKDFFEYHGGEGVLSIMGSRDAFRLAFRRGLIADGDVWMEMIKSRQLTSHTYNEEISAKVFEDIVEKYYAAFVALKETLEQRLD